MPILPSRTSAMAASMAMITALDLGATAIAMVAWARLSRASGMPISCTAWAAATAVVSAVGSARPTSSLARMTRRRAMKRGSSPASNMRAR